MATHYANVRGAISAWLEFISLLALGFGMPPSCKSVCSYFEIIKLATLCKMKKNKDVVLEQLHIPQIPDSIVLNNRYDTFWH